MVEIVSEKTFQDEIVGIFTPIVTMICEDGYRHRNMKLFCSSINALLFCNKTINQLCIGFIKYMEFRHFSHKISFPSLRAMKIKNIYQGFDQHPYIQELCVAYYFDPIITKTFVPFTNLRKLSLRQNSPNWNIIINSNPNLNYLSIQNLYTLDKLKPHFGIKFLCSRDSSDNFLDMFPNVKIFKYNGSLTLMGWERSIDTLFLDYETRSGEMHYMYITGYVNRHTHISNLVFCRNFELLEMHNATVDNVIFCENREFYDELSTSKHWSLGFPTSSLENKTTIIPKSQSQCTKLLQLLIKYINEKKEISAGLGIHNLDNKFMLYKSRKYMDLIKPYLVHSIPPQIYAIIKSIKCKDYSILINHFTCN